MNLIDQATQPSKPEYRTCACGKRFRVRPHKWLTQAWCSKECAAPMRTSIEPTEDAIRGRYRMIPLTLGKFATVDEENYEWLMRWTWYAVWMPGARTHYADRHAPKQPDGKRPHILMHRFIMGEPEGLMVDHEDHDGLNCRRYNLRVATCAQNNRNARKYKSNPDGLKGVTYAADRKRWRAMISVDGRVIHLGGFPTKEGAAEAYRAAALKYHGDFAFIPGDTMKKDDAECLTPAPNQ